MAQDILLKNQVWDDVPAVNLPIDGGGMQRFTDVSNTTAVPSDVASGKIFFNSSGIQQTGTSSGGGANLQTKSVTYTPTTSQQTDTITPDTGYDGLSSVGITVNAMTPLTFPTTTKATSTGSEIAQIRATSIGERYLNIPVGYNDSEKYYTIEKITSGTAGTPTATKGTVSNHSVSVTPSVTNTSGYITGSTINGTAVTVSASELVSGSETKTQNGTYNVTNLAELVVAVPTGGATLQSKSKSYTPSETAQSETVRPDSGYDGLSSVDISVGAIPSNYVGSGITRRDDDDMSGVVDDPYYVVSAPSGYYPSSAEFTLPLMTLPSTADSTFSGTRKANILPSTSQRYLNIPSGYNPTAQFYQIIGAELLPLNVTQNGTYDPATYDVFGFGTVTVDVPSGGSSTCATTTMTNSNDQAKSIQFTNLSGEPKWFFVRCTSQLTRSSSYSYYYITDIRYNGTNHNGNYYRRSNGTFYNDTSHYSHTYSNGTLTISSSASRGSAGGSFYNGTYELVYIY